MILLIDNYDSFTYNIYQYIESLGQRCTVVRNDKITIEGIRQAKPKALVISPGPGNPDSAGVSLEAIKAFSATLPILGVCLGHQSIGQAFGGKIIRAPKPKHGKISKIQHDARGIFEGLENPFAAARYHSLIIDRNSMPDCLAISAETSDGIVMGVRHKKFRVEGVQFHPESIATEGGMRLIENFLRQVS